MDASLQNLITQTFAGLEAKDLNALMGLFDEDALLIDPHFPAHTLRGHTEIRDGFKTSIARTRSYGYQIRNSFASENAQGAAVEVNTHHVLETGKHLEFPQVFVFETVNGRITRLQAYEPYGPPGVVGFFIGLARLKRRLFGASASRDARTSVHHS
jgi:ketosteroid isomerase-like protein